MHVVAMSPTWFDRASVLGGGQRLPENLPQFVLDFYRPVVDTHHAA